MSELKLTSKAIDAIITNGITHTILEELNKAKTKHPNWPNNKHKQMTIIVEEIGEAARALLHYEDEEGTIEQVEEELIQSAAMCIRMLEHIQYEKLNNT